MFRNVIHFPSRPGGGRHLQALAEIESYWHVRAAGRPMPERAEIGPHGMEAALPHALLLERIAPGIGRLRLAGQHLRDLMGMELRGMPMSALFEAEARSRLAEAIDRALDLPALVHVDLSAAPGLGRPGLAGRLFLAPLSSPGGRPKMLLGGLAMTGTAGGTPRRLSVDAVSARPVEETRRPCPGDSHLPVAGPASRGEAPAERERPDALRPALRLVSSGA